MTGLRWSFAILAFTLRLAIGFASGSARYPLRSPLPPPRTCPPEEAPEERPLVARPENHRGRGFGIGVLAHPPQTLLCVQVGSQRLVYHPGSCSSLANSLPVAGQEPRLREDRGGHGHDLSVECERIGCHLL